MMLLHHFKCNHIIIFKGFVMARQARIVIPEQFHHISQKSADGTRIFFDKEDFQKYDDIIRVQSNLKNLDIYSYCYFPNQIQILCVPKNKSDLATIIGEANRQYTKYFNNKNNKTGSVFYSRFFSYTVDELFALRAARYIERFPVTRILTDKAQNYLWSSAKFRVKNMPDDFLYHFKNFHTIQNWENFLDRPMDINEMKLVETHLQTGRPRGSDFFLDRVEKEIGRYCSPTKTGKKIQISASRINFYIRLGVSIPKISNPFSKISTVILDSFNRLWRTSLSSSDRM